MNISEMKICTCCQRNLPLTDFYLRHESKIGIRRSRCRWCFMAGKDKLRKLLGQVKHRCKKTGIEFTLRPSDITVPEVCPVLGIPLRWGWDSRERGYRDSSPSLDRLNPRGGYTPSNVIVVSHRANRLRSDASVAEIEAILSFYRDKSP